MFASSRKKQPVGWGFLTDRHRGAVLSLLLTSCVIWGQ